MLLKNKRIFIVEDNLANRAIMQIALEHEGAKTGIDRWGLHTLEQLRQFAPVDLILLDLMFPDNTTGYDVFDHIRSDATFIQIPIVAVSASDPTEAIPRTVAKGFAGFIRKPINQNKLPQQILAILQGEPVWDRS